MPRSTVWPRIRRGLYSDIAVSFPVPMTWVRNLCLMLHHAGRAKMLQCHQATEATV